MQILLFLALIGLPIAEIALFIEAGRAIGVFPVILVTIGSAVLGTVLMRIQGFATLNGVMQSVNRGEAPVGPMMDGFGILLAGMLLLLPGLLTDAVGLLLFIPPVRRGLLKWMAGRMTGRVHTQFSHHETSAGPAPQRPQPTRPAKDRFKRSEDVIDAEFETIDPAEDAAKKGPDGQPLVNGHKSPWRRS
jgi:UPF0716 protein FxsA